MAAAGPARPRRAAARSLLFCLRTGRDPARAAAPAGSVERPLARAAGGQRGRDVAGGHVVADGVAQLKVPARESHCSGILPSPDPGEGRGGRPSHSGPGARERRRIGAGELRAPDGARAERVREHDRPLQVLMDVPPAAAGMQ